MKHQIGLLFAENSANAENSAAVPAVSTSFSAAYEWPLHCTPSVQVKDGEIKDDMKLISVNVGLPQPVTRNGDPVL